LILQLCAFLSCINCNVSSTDIAECIKRFKFFRYLSSPANWLDWAHFFMMSVGWAFWYALVRQTETFKVEEKYEILVSTIDQTPARFLLTDPVAEMKFLQFSKSITDLEKNMRFYTNIIGSCGNFKILFFELWL
jgi:hypothetical protein